MVSDRSARSFARGAGYVAGVGHLRRSEQPVTVVLILTPLAYLLGTFPSALLVARAGGHNVLAEGSRNPGASNVTRLMGWRAGLLVLVADFGKGAIAAGAGYAIDERFGAYVLGVAAILGHVLPATRRFKGGKGVATAGGVLVVLFPWIVAGLAVVWVVVARVFKKASIASIVGTIAFPVLVAVSGYHWRETVVISALAVLVLLRHLSNLKRLLRGGEPGLGGDSGTVPG